jgi:hypothetical protein
MGDVIAWLLAIKPEVWTALATVVIASFTVVLALVIRRQARLTREALKLARDEFISTHRPKIIVRTFEYCSDGGGRIGAAIRYVNAGDSVATITEIGVSIFLSVEGPRPGGDQVMTAERVISKRLLGGEEAVYVAASGVTHNEVAVQQVRNHRQYPFTSAYCIGYIAYADELGVGRKTGFCRQYEPANRSWARTEHSDYDYAY